MNKVWDPLTKVREFRVKLYPKNFELIRGFYETTLGFPVTNEWSRGNDQGVMFDTGGATLELLTPDEYKPISGCTLSLEVSDVWKLWEKFKQNQKVIFALRHNSWGDTSFRIADPEDLEITFFTKDKPNKSNGT